jgi:hypothetical protein
LIVHNLLQTARSSEGQAKKPLLGQKDQRTNLDPLGFDHRHLQPFSSARFTTEHLQARDRTQAKTANRPLALKGAVLEEEEGNTLLPSSARLDFVSG